LPREHFVPDKVGGEGKSIKVRADIHRNGRDDVLGQIIIRDSFIYDKLSGHYETLGGFMHE
jgi:hypothetical protein